jgi:hypothetical protein
MADYGVEPVVAMRFNGDQVAVHETADVMMYNGHGHSSFNGNNVDAAHSCEQEEGVVSTDDYGAEYTRDPLSSMDDIPVTQEDAWAVIS